MITVIEDPFVRRLLRSMLARYGYEIVESTTPKMTERLTTGPAPTGVLITNSPADLLSIAGELPIVYTSACPDPDLASRFSHCRTLKKPFSADELLTAIEEAQPTAHVM